MCFEEERPLMRGDLCVLETCRYDLVIRTVYEDLLLLLDSPRNLMDHLDHFVNAVCALLYDVCMLPMKGLYCGLRGSVFAKHCRDSMLEEQRLWLYIRRILLTVAYELALFASSDVGLSLLIVMTYDVLGSTKIVRDIFLLKKHGTVFHTLLGLMGAGLIDFQTMSQVVQHISPPRREAFWSFLTNTS